jgi:hypothetical protein
LSIIVEPVGPKEPDLDAVSARLQQVESKQNEAIVAKNQ